MLRLLAELLFPTPRVVAEHQLRDAVARRDWPRATASQRLLLVLDQAQWLPGLRFARVLRKAGEHEQARSLLEDMRRSRPEDVDTLVELGHLESWVGRTDAATRCYAEARRLAPGNPGIATELKQAEVLLAENRGGTTADWRQRLRDVEAEIAAGQESRCGRAAELAVRLGDHALAEGWLRRYRAWAGTAGALARHDAARQSADFYWLTGNWSDALACYLEAETYLSATPVGRSPETTRRLDRCIAMIYPPLGVRPAIPART